MGVPQKGHRYPRRSGVSVEVGELSKLVQDDPDIFYVLDFFKCQPPRQVAGASSDSYFSWLLQCSQRLFHASDLTRWQRLSYEVSRWTVTVANRQVSSHCEYGPVTYASTLKRRSCSAYRQFCPLRADG